MDISSLRQQFDGELAAAQTEAELRALRDRYLARKGGLVLLRVLVSESGEPVDIQIVQGVSGGLTESAVRAMRNWRFEPALRNGVPVRAWTTIPIPFEP